MAETATVKKPLLVTPLLEDNPCDIETVNNKEVLKLLGAGGCCRKVCLVV
jgi:hypothetical protein